MKIDFNRDIFMGHEFSGEVLAAGPDTEAPPPGTLVTSMPALLSPTGIDLIMYSNSTIGGYAERMLLSVPLLMPIPNGLDPRYAALTEPMAVGLHAVNKSAVAPGEVALVIGCGPVGIAIIAALRHRGVETLSPLTIHPSAGSWPRRWGRTSALTPPRGLRSNRRALQ